MRPLRSFTIEPSLPEALSPLLDVAYNLWWTWHGDVLELFRRLDAELWEDCYHNPVAMLGRIDQEALEAVAADEAFMAHLLRVYGELEYYLERPGWWMKTYGGDRNHPQVAYFCAEFGIHEVLPIYSGGLGVLAGDHLKSASELDIPLVGVGLLYQQGYFRQRLNADGWQLELFPRNDFHNMPVTPVKEADGAPLKINIELGERTVKAQAWRVDVGRVRLYLLDANVPENSPEDRHITAQLYGGDQETRIQQEIVLGIGGVRMLKALGIEPKVFHMNEGHSAFMSLERVRMLMAEQSASFDEACEAVAAANVFTTHTPVPAGNDAFEPWVVDKYLSGYWGQLGLTREEFLALGRLESGDPKEPMNLTVLALRLSRCRNSVSHLHAQTTREMWTSLWPGVPVDEIPITSITNGVHTPSWISYDMAQLYDRYLGPGWYEKPADIGVWQGVQHIPDPELWRTHERRRERLVASVRRRLAAQLTKREASRAEIAAAEEVLDPEALTIGFARRFATYKRAGLILSDLDRLAKLLTNPDRRVQIIFAGKAHPRDKPGKDLIRQIVHISRREAFRDSMVFLEDYDINVARYLVQGVDVWLNTPLRPMEASGTSGMKVAANGGLNLSILDGWWAEGYSPDVGWAIGSGEAYDDLDYQNTVESQALYDLLEKQIVPLFYDRGQDNLPRGWIAKMRAAMGRLAPVYNTNRMVRQYAEMFYAPAARAWADLVGSDMGRARQVSAWKRKLRQGFRTVRVESVTDNLTAGSNARVGADLVVEAAVDPGTLAPEDLRVELYYGPLDEHGQLTSGQRVPMERAASPDGAHPRYSGRMPCDRSGSAGYTVRVLPRRATDAESLDMALICWAYQ